LVRRNAFGLPVLSYLGLAELPQPPYFSTTQIYMGNSSLEFLMSEFSSLWKNFNFMGARKIFTTPFWGSVVPQWAGLMEEDAKKTWGGREVVRSV